LPGLAGTFHYIESGAANKAAGESPRQKAINAFVADVVTTTI
jgi:hypothetical protein